MIIDTISPTFSYPSAANFYEISTDGGQTYSSASTLELNYYALDKMEEDFSELNPLRILFRKKEDIQDDAEYAVTKILVNQDSIFLTTDLGLNVISVGSQSVKEPPALYTGNYAIYNSTTTGGLNFRDFKLTSIKTSQTTRTEMQMVFFVTPTGGMWVTIETPRLELDQTITGHSTLKLNVAIKEDKTNKVRYNTQKKKYEVWIDNNTTQIKITTNLYQGNLQTTNCYFNVEGGSSEEEYGGKEPVGSNVGRIYAFVYAMTMHNCFDTSLEIAESTRTGDITWTIPIQEIIWTEDPKIVFEITKIRCTYRNSEWGITENYIWYGY